MVTGEKAEEQQAANPAEVTQTPPLEGGEDAEQTEAQEPDAAAQVVELQAERDKLQNDLRAEQGRRRTRDNTESLLQGIADRLEVQERTNSALIRAMASGETEALETEAQTIRDEFESNRGARSVEKVSQSLSNDIQNAVKGSDGTTLIELSDPRLSGALQLWQAGNERQDVASWTAAYAEVQRVVREVEREQAQGQVKAAEAAGQERVQQALRDNGVTDLSTGRPAGGAPQNDADTWAAYGRGEMDWSPRVREAGRNLGITD